MYVCVCKAINKQTLEKLLKECSGDMTELKKKSGVGTDCGSCLNRLMSIVKDESEDLETDL